MKLEEIGFYTLHDARARQASRHSPLWRAELILTDRCNFQCPYCRGIQEEHQGSLTLEEAKHVVTQWAEQGLKNVRFSGGEPTVWKGLPQLVSHARAMEVERIAISTNGSVDTRYYDLLASQGVNDFSISLDACCSETGDRMAGDRKGAWQRVVHNIRHLARHTYVTVGVVLTPENMGEFRDIVHFASDELGVADIRIVSSAQWNEGMTDVGIEEKYLARHPILRYRMQGFCSGRNIRGLRDGDCGRCSLVLDDMAVLDGEHYPCIIYLREGGRAIGKLQGDYRGARAEWCDRHDSFMDPICRKNCLDVCIDYNNKARDLQGDRPLKKPRRIIPIQSV